MKLLILLSLLVFPALVQAECKGFSAFQCENRRNRYTQFIFKVSYPKDRYGKCNRGGDFVAGKVRQHILSNSYLVRKCKNAYGLEEMASAADYERRNHYMVEDMYSNALDDCLYNSFFSCFPGNEIRI